MTWWHYLLLANVYLTLFFLFYALFLRKETFFNLNRVYLVSSALLSFFIPIIQSSWIKNLFITQRVKETIYQVGPTVMHSFKVTANAATHHQQLTLGQILLGIYVTGILVLTVKFIYQLAVINYVISQPKSDTSYSFFNRIRIEERDTDNDAITAHEQVHARQWHSADVLLLETIMILNWFNPVVYLYRNAVKYIHEFIADRDALKAGLNKADYAMLLVSQTFITPPYHLVNPFFNSSLLKQRIQMLHKDKSHWAMLMKYGLSAPLFALMLVLSSATVNNSKTIQVINQTASDVFKTPASQTFSTGVISEADQEDLEAVIKQHQQGAAMAAVTADGTQTDASGKQIVSRIERGAEFPGGIQAFGDYLSENIRYPVEARQKNVQGKVFCSFIVEKDGSISGLKVVRGIGSGADEEAIRVLSAMPKWEPGTQNGANVRQLYTVPISFSLSDTPAKPVNDTEVFTAVEQSAMFPGGMDAFSRYLSKTIRYPMEAREKRIQGKVLLNFIVEKDGSISDIRVARETGGGLSDEAVRVVKQSPRWVPAMQNGVPVRQRYTTPISFSLTDDLVADTRKDAAMQPNTFIIPAINERLADTSSMEARFVSHIKSPAAPANDAKINQPVAKTGGIKPLNILKDKAAKSMFGEKATNGIVLMLTKRKPFYDQEILATDR